MSKVAMSLLITLSINLFLFLVQLGVEDINPSAHVFDKNTGIINSVDAGGYVLSENITRGLPGSQASVSPTTGNIFTDTFTSIKDWFLDTTGVGYLYAILTAVPNFLKSIQVLPDGFVFAVSAFWYIYNFMLVLMFFWGDRD